jgi:hypothetical protein
MFSQVVVSHTYPLLFLLCQAYPFSLSCTHTHTHTHTHTLSLSLTSSDLKRLTTLVQVDGGGGNQSFLAVVKGAAEVVGPMLAGAPQDFEKVRGLRNGGSGVLMT